MHTASMDTTDAGIIGRDVLQNEAEKLVREIINGLNQKDWSLRRLSQRGTEK